jgi:hypothetical protein
MLHKTLKLTVLSLALIAGASGAQAQATRTWVSGVGDDVNPCSRTAPCKTFAGAISKTAASGEINVLDPGGFGTVTITKSITIDGGGSISGVLASGTTGIVVSAPAGSVVTLRNLDIDGSGTGVSGIRFLSGDALHVQNCTIYGFTEKGIDFVPTTTAALYVDGTLLRANAVGLFVKPGAAVTATATVAGSRFDNSLLGAGVWAGDRSKISITGSTASGNVGNGFAIVSTADPAEMNLETCVATGNGLNGLASVGAAAVIRMSGTLISHNDASIGVAGGGKVLSYGNNRIAGNTTNSGPTGTIGLQ